MAAVMALASKLCIENQTDEQEQHGVLLPCRKLSPLAPYMELEEYEMLERDKGKYLLYMAAINQAVADTVSRQQEASEDRDVLCIKCLVLGPGLGRLIKFCVDAASQQGVRVAVHALEANPLAVDFLNKEFADYLGKEVVVYNAFTFHPHISREDLPEGIKPHCRTFDIIVSELLGCFGDDEFLPELTAALAEMFLKPNEGIMIPQSWTNYIVPVSSPDTYKFLTILIRPLDAGYVMGLPKDCVFLSNTAVTWTGNCYERAARYSAAIEFDIGCGELRDIRAKVKCNCCEECICKVVVKASHEEACISINTIKGSTSERNHDIIFSETCSKAECLDEQPLETSRLAEQTKTGIRRSKQQQSSLLAACAQNLPNKTNTDAGQVDTQTSTITCCAHNLPSGIKGKDTHTPAQGDEQLHRATLPTALSHRTSVDSEGCRCLDVITCDNEPTADSCKCHCHKLPTEEQKADTSKIKDIVLHGFIGYFTSVLYGDIMIDTRHTSIGRNSFHWECFFFPLREPLRLSSSASLTASSIKLHLERKCEQMTKLNPSLRLWYEWQVTVIDCVCVSCVIKGEGLNRQQLETEASNDFDEMNKRVEQLKGSYGDETAAVTVGNSLPRTYSETGQRQMHVYPLQNAGGSTDVVLLQANAATNQYSVLTENDECHSFKTKLKKQKLS